MTAKKQTENQNKLRAILQDLTEKSGITERALARLLSIPPTTLYQLLNTDTPNPSVKTLLPIAKHFKISIEQLIGEEPINTTLNNSFDSQPWQPELFNKALNTVNQALEENKRRINTKTAINIIRELYFYSLSNNLQDIDANFANWIINKSLNEASN